MIKDRKHKDFKSKVEMGLELSLKDLKGLCKVNYTVYVNQRIKEDEVIH